MIRNIQPVSQAKYVFLALMGFLLLQTAITAHASGNALWNDPPLILYARSDGNWKDLTWTLEDESTTSEKPTSNDVVIILGATVTITTEVSCASLEVKHEGSNPGVLNILGSGKLTVFGPVSVVKNTNDTNKIFLSDNGDLLIQYSEFSPPCYLATPENLIASNITQSSVDLSWDAVLGTCLTGYRVYVNPGKTGNYEINLPASSTTVTIDHLSSGNVHTFEVGALGTNNFESTKRTITVNTLPNESPGGVEVLGELKKWHKVTVQFNGPFASETGSPNPFLDYRLDVTFTHIATGRTYEVPGYFAADGHAADSSSDEGNKWRVHFAPDSVGTWTYTASFVQGSGIAVNDGTGTPDTTIHGKSGSFEIAPTDKTGNDNRAKGRLKYIEEHYLQYAETGEYFLKGGADSPENFLSYKEFDGTQNSDGIDDTFDEENGHIKTWGPHKSHWKEGDPTWYNEISGKSERGKGIIGAINYLASQGMNVFSFLTMNIGGDDKNVFPYINYNATLSSSPVNDRLRFDVSKLDQWEIVFEHADRLGMYLHFKLQETELDQLLDGGKLETERRLYYREMIARFGHHLALNWNLGEEHKLWAKGKLNDKENEYLKQYAQYFYENDPYHHHIVVHTNTDKKENVYPYLLGNQSKLTGFSLQSNFTKVHEETKYWRQQSVIKGKKWVAANDEQGPASYGVPVDGKNHDDPDDNFGEYSQEHIRKYALWGNLMAGGGGVEYYFGDPKLTTEGDVNCQDYTTRSDMWNYTRYALQFFRSFPFHQMENYNELIGNTTDTNDRYCFAELGKRYVVYLPSGGTTSLDISGYSNETFEIAWYNPRSGQYNGPIEIVSNTNSIALEAPSTNEDWAALITRQGLSNLFVSIDNVPELYLPTDSTILITRVNNAQGNVTYAWSKIAGGTAILGDTTQATLKVTGLQLGEYTFKVEVTDQQGNQAENTVSVIVNDQASNEPAITAVRLLNAQQNAGSNTVLVSNLNSGTIIYLNDLPTDSLAIQAITNDLPIQKIDFSLSFPNGTDIHERTEQVAPYTLFGDSEGSYTSWEPTPPPLGLYQLTITPYGADGQAGIVKNINFEFSPNSGGGGGSGNGIIVEAGDDQEITLPTNSITLNGSITDPDNGSITNIVWSQEDDNPVVTLTNPNTANLTVSNLNTIGTYVFRLTATDNQGDTGQDEVTVVVRNTSTPQILSFGLYNAVTDQKINGFNTIDNGETINLFNFGGDSLNILAQTSGNFQRIAFHYTPPAPDNSFSRNESVGPYALFGDDSQGDIYGWDPTPPTLGAYNLTAIMHSAAGNNPIDTLSINFTLINEVTSGQPQFSVSNDQTIFLPQDSVMLTATGSDPDGGEVTFAWEQLPGSPNASLSDLNNDTLYVTGLTQAGTYEFQLTITDDEQQNASAIVRITVQSSNVTAVASFQLIGSETDNILGYIDDGDVINLQSYADSSLNIKANTTGFVQRIEFKLNRPDNPQYFRKEETSPYALFGDLEGDYDHWIPSPPPLGAYTLTAVPHTAAGNNPGDSLTIHFTIVDTAGTVAPTILSITPDLNLTLPLDSIVLTANAEDPDGGGVGYKWTRLLGPTGISMSQPEEPMLIVKNVLAGSYTFQLIVTDNDQETVSAQVNVTVSETDTLAVTDFVLVDAQNDIPIPQYDPIPQNAIINLLELGTDSLNIIARTQPDSIGSVVFDLSGPKVYGVTESVGPYALFKDLEGDYYSWNPVPPDTGTYFLTATPYDAPNGNGTDGRAKQLTFTFTMGAEKVPPTASIAGEGYSISMPNDSITITGTGQDPDGGAVFYLWEQLAGPYTATLVGDSTATLLAKDLFPGQYEFRLTVTDEEGQIATAEVSVTVEGITVAWFTLFDAATDQMVTGYEKISDGDTLDLTSLGADSIAIVAQTYPATVGSVKFILSGTQSYQKTESVGPYALFRDTDGDYRPWEPYPPAEGPYQLEAIPYTDASGTGQSGKKLKISFTITNSVGN